ncbi:MAG TPA: outer membrane protein transport protein [Balneolaceae bacterium]|nr:outer membrane protein transport protein [Balneolaceae bacterium]
MSKKWIAGFLFMVTLAVSAKAQSADDVLRYSLEYPSYDPVSLVMPSVSTATGFGAYQANPAVMALFDDSYFSFSLSSRFINESAAYLGNTSDFSDNQTNIGHVGFVYKVPTTQGSLVVGGGYSQTTDFNRAFSVSGFNNSSTITDFYAYLPRTDSVNTVAYNVFAIEDVGADSSVSIFRLNSPFLAYPGINQDVEVVEEGVLGEYSAFFATELLKNFSVGVSIGYLTGTYSYRREFLESDRRHYYDGLFIDSDGDGDFDTDINSIYSLSTTTAELEAFSARLGLVYQPIENLNLGLSYEFPASIRITERYNFQMTTTFDNGVQYSDESPGGFVYTIVRPQRLKAGFTLESDAGLVLSASAEAVPYSQGHIKFDELEFSPRENDINSTVESSLNDVINLRGGLAFKVNSRFTPRIGYAYFPSPQVEAGSARQFISGGFSAELTKGLVLDIGLQYSFWEDQNVLYSTPRVFEVVEEDVSRIHAMFGIKMAL